MNATKAGMGKAGIRAAIGTTDIEATRRRIAASAGADLKQKALAAQAGSPKLRTEREGRMFAVDALERLDNVNADKATVYPFGDAMSYGSDEILKPYRKGPQWDGFYRDLSALVESASPEAVKGFASIFTDCLASDIGFNLGVYRELEAEGKFLDFGAPGTKYQAPKPVGTTRAQRVKEEKVVQGQYLPKGEAAAIEAYLIDSAKPRRAALAFLERPYAEIVEAIKSDDVAAAAFSELVVDLEGMKQHYLSIALHISRAASEVKRAVLERGEARQQSRNKRQRAK